MDVVINGEMLSVDEGATVSTVVASALEDPARLGSVAVAVNDQVVARTDWEITELSAGDRIEVLTAMQGG